STHNQRIERLWVDVGIQFARRWRGFFTRLEQVHGLNRKNPHHLWLLHQLFLPLINADCDQFRNEWNHHAIRGSQTRDQTPADIRFLAAVERGTYKEVDEYQDVHPDLLNRYYGVSGVPRFRAPGQTGAGHPPDEDIEALVAADQAANIRHEPIKVARHTSPFSLDELEQGFWDVYAEVQASGIVPSGMMLRDSEWDDGEYPTFEDITVGIRTRKTMSVALPREVWYPRALAWCQALHLMADVLVTVDLEDL
ncbi:hypothetical protein BV25DRAFT_1807634, partial [Artomyces pyxidatus]